MQTKNVLIFIFIFGLIALIQLYFFKHIKKILYTNLFFYVKWFSYISLFILFILTANFFTNALPLKKSLLLQTIFFITFAYTVAQILSSIFFVLDDIIKGTKILVVKMGHYFSNKKNVAPDNVISRSQFFIWLGTIIGGFFWSNILVGFFNKNNFNFKNVSIPLDKLPSNFTNFKIIQISDIHSGGLSNKKAIEKIILKINNYNPDLILFTGDIVNNEANEMDEWIEVFKKLNAKYGVYSILGNHDYGDYIKWDSPQAKENNFLKVKQIHQQLGWKLLLNEHQIIKINNQQIALIGVENWSNRKNFPKKGRLDLANAGLAENDFKILLSHDPSHWDAQIIPSFSSIDLTLSGHTHGMQFGLINPFFKWSPIQYVYKQWAGLYKKNNQYLYVNTGFGCIGYLGRVGILPEITIIHLKKG